MHFSGTSCPRWQTIMSKRKRTRRFERLENRVLPAFSTELLTLLGTDDAYPGSLVNVNGTLFFAADDGVHGRELWKSDGTAAGTVMLKDINPNGVSNPDSMVNVNGIVFFTAHNGTNGRELWKADGTEYGTVLVKDINPGAVGSYSNGLTNVNGTLFFAANDGTNGMELWKSNGTPLGTVQVANIRPAGNGSVP